MNLSQNAPLNFTLDGAQSLNLQAFLSSRQAGFNDKLCATEEDISFIQPDISHFSDDPVASLTTPIRFQSLKDLVQETKDVFFLSNPTDVRWPCPFCLHLSQTKVQCRCHILRNHPHADIALNYEIEIPKHPICVSSSVVNDSSSPVDDSPSPSPDVRIPSVMFSSQSNHVDIVCIRCVGSSKTFKGLSSLRSHYSHSHKEFLSDFDQPHHLQSSKFQQPAPSTLSSDKALNFEFEIPNHPSSVVNDSSQTNHVNLFCFRCVDSSKTFKGLRGLRTHYSRSHKEFLSDFDQPHQLQSNNVQQPAPPISSSDPNNLICYRCTGNKKFYKGIRGLRIHYAHAHKDFLSDLSQLTGADSQSINHPNSSCDLNQFVQKLLSYRQTVRVLKRIPKGARIAAAKKLEELIIACATLNNLQSWINLLSFSYIALQVPKRSSKKNKLTSIIKKNILNFGESPILNQVKPKSASLAKRVEMKISDGDVRGAVKIISSNEGFAPQSQETLEQLRLKHPSPLHPVNFPAAPQESDFHYVTSDVEVFKAIFSFPNGSPSGIDGLRPQILKDLLCKETGEIGNRLLTATTKLCNLMLAGKVSESIIPVLYGASLCALIKNDGGLRPIAIGVTFRRLTAKIACFSIREPVGEYLRPHQLGFATKGGCEAAIHASRSFVVKNRGKSKVVLKIDFRNAFNSINRDSMLNSIKENAPGLFPFLWQCYEQNSHLFFGNDLISSQMGAQQGDPCGPLLFCLVIQPMIESLSSELNVCYLDDGTVAGDFDSVLNDFARIINFGKEIGLEINSSKCELYFCSSFDQSIYDKFAELSPGIQTIASELHLLGAPLTDSSGETIFNKKFIDLQTMFSRLKDLNHHIAYNLLKHCFAVPKLTFLLRTFPIWKFPHLVSRFDNLIFQTLQEILNVNLNNDKWILASLPVRNGGVGIRRVQDIAIPSFLSSIAGVSELICTILPSLQTDFSVISGFDETLNAWNFMCPGTSSPTQPSSQQSWDAININRISNGFSFNSDADKARYKASLCNESGAWLTVLPSKNLGTLLDDNAFRIAVALRLGCVICTPHWCVCGDFVDNTGVHGLSCGKSAGRQYRHRFINDILKRTFNLAEIPARLEPESLSRNDGKRPDGMTLVPWSNGQILVWDATCWDTLAPSYVKKSATNPGSAAKMAANRKRSLYSDIINQNYLFIPFACETLGPWCKESIDIINSLKSIIKRSTGEPRSTSFIIQKISITIQRANAASIMGTLPESEKLTEIYFLL